MVLHVNNNQHTDFQQIVLMNPFSYNELFPEMKNGFTPVFLLEKKLFSNFHNHLFDQTHNVVTSAAN